MAGSLGSLVVSLGLDATQFFTGLTKSQYEAKKFAESLNRDIATAATIAGSALVVMAGGAVAALAAINNLARQAGSFQDIAEKIGTSAESVAGFAVSLNVTGKSVEELGDFSVKLSKNLAGVSDGTDKAGAALIALGLNIKTFKELDPAKQIDALSAALAKFSDQGGGKAAALEAIAKGGAALLPFLKELNEAGGRQVILTEAQIQEADKYSDAQARAKEQLRLYAEVVAVKTLPAITALTGAAKEFLKELLNMDSKSADLANNRSIETWADKGAKAIAFLVDAGDGVARVFQIMGTSIAASAAITVTTFSGDFKRALEIAKDFKREVDAIANRPFFSDKLAEQIANRGKNPVVTPGVRPQLKFEGALDGGVGKSILDGQIKALEAAIQREKDLLNARADYLRDYFQDGLLSVADYYGKLQSARDEELSNVLRFLDQEIAAQRAFQANAKKASERQDAQTKIEGIQEKQNKLLRDAQTEDEKLSRQRARSDQEYLDQLGEINAKMLEIAGNAEAAASIRFDAQNRIQINRFTASGDLDAVRNVAAIKQQEQNVISLNKAQNDYQNTVEKVGIALARVDLLAQTGALTEIDAINRKADVARQYITILAKEADAYQTIADKLAAGPARDAALRQVERLRLEIDQLAAATDVLAKKFNDIFAGAIADGIVELVSGTKKLKDVLQDIGKSITTQITQIAAKQVSESLFAKGGPLGGVGDFFAGIFGGKSASDTTGAAGLTTAGSTLTIAGTGLNTAAIGLNAAALALSASSATSAVSSAFGKGNQDLGDLLGLFGDVPFLGAGKTVDTAGATALTAAGSSLTLAGTSLTLSGTGLNTAAIALSSAAAALAASSAASALGGSAGSLFGGGGGGFGTGSAFGNMDFGGFFASGGNPPVGKVSVFGEHGPELWVPKTAGTIIPNSVLSQRRVEKQQSVTLHYYAAPGVSKQTAHQHAVDMARTIDTARKLNR